jgi:hypothetical protein
MKTVIVSLLHKTREAIFTLTQAFMGRKFTSENNDVEFLTKKSEPNIVSNAIDLSSAHRELLSS